MSQASKLPANNTDLGLAIGANPRPFNFNHLEKGHHQDLPVEIGS
jgi:hypothetical protein